MTDTANQRYAHSGTPEDLFNAVLHMHVKDGSVNYAALRNDPGLREYCDILSQTGPQFIADPKAQLAFWINVYNAYTLKVICDEQPVRSISERLSTSSLVKDPSISPRSRIAELMEATSFTLPPSTIAIEPGVAESFECVDVYL